MLRQLAKSRFVANVSTLVSGKVVAAGITFLGTPIVTRLFSPEDYGVAALFATVVTVVGGVAALNYPSAILLSMSERRAALLRRLSLLILTLVCLVCYVLLAIAEMRQFQLPVVESLELWVWLVPAAVWGTGASLLARNVLANARLYNAISVAAVGQSVGTVGSRVGFGLLFGSTIWGLMVGYMLGIIANLGIMWTRVVTIPKTARSRISHRRLRIVARKYSDFPIYNMPANLLSEVSSKLPIFVMGPWLGMQVVGFYAMAHRLVGMPLSLAGTSFRMVMLQKASAVREAGGNLTVLYLKAALGLAVVGIAPFGLLWAFGELALSLFLGENWSQAGRYVEIMVPWYYSTWVSALVPPFMVSMRRQGLWLWLQVGILIGRAASFGYGYWLDAPVEMVLRIFVWANVGMLAFVFLIGLVETRRVRS